MFLSWDAWYTTDPLVSRTHAAKLLALLAVPGETFLSKDDIQIGCQQARHSSLPSVFPHVMSLGGQPLRFRY